MYAREEDQPIEKIIVFNILKNGEPGGWGN